MSKPTHNVVYKGRSFAGEDGASRHVYPVIGAAWPDQDGNLNRIVLDTLPVNFDGVLYLRAREEGTQ